jgi:Mn2+/Fe2+ NRAMP family transporter
MDRTRIGSAGLCTVHAGQARTTFDNACIPRQNSPRMNRLRALGPGLLVTAAFIGPGTVTTATLAGAGYGLSLLWAVVFSTLATIALQEMSARIGLAARMGPAEALRAAIRSRSLRRIALGLVVAAIAFGNAAFQVGNITGAAIGLEAATGLPARVGAVAVGLAAAALLFSGAYRHIERFLIGLVVLMSMAFLATAIMVLQTRGLRLGGLYPHVPTGSVLTIIALIGTTVVPYNLFLHAAAVQAKWPVGSPLPEALRGARLDAGISIAIGGLVTAAIMVTAAAFFQRGTAIGSAGQMAAQLEPVLGPAARHLFLIGLMAAGFTSALTAPMAAAYAVGGTFGWPADLRSSRLRAVWLAVVLCGTLFAAFGRQPIEAIRLAQAFNGLLLPIIASFLLYVMNQRSILGRHANGPLANTLGAIVVLTTAALGTLQIAKSLGLAR